MHENQQAPEAEQPTDAVPGAAQDERVQELEDRLLRVLADADNLRKRHIRELREQREEERRRVTAAWLPVVDNLELALTHADIDAATTDPVLAGVLAVRDQAVHVLTQLGYPRDDEAGVPFDPARHEVTAVVDDPDVPPGTVVQVLRPGYGEPGHQLRPAAVAVTRGQG